MNLIKLFNYFQWCTERADGIVFNLPSPSVWSRNFQWKTEKKQQRRKAEEGRKKWRKKRQRRCWAVRGGLRSWKTVKPFTSCAQQAREIFYRTRTENQIKRLSSYRESGRRAECQREPNINIRGDRHRCFVLFFFFGWIGARLAARNNKPQPCECVCTRGVLAKRKKKESETVKLKHKI